ncbi:hypothetical protein CHLRE_06g258226v5 [Chlamydomonas reinhardtii]|uniref:Glycoside hydrolase family 42 N-terminal domain-containing protein n=1 Tax=Chlamydomonas reinhardtii TaxID=3055 RepID=A0A2K3DMI9_CHLRE|nr:uncharacterized protein CHLRE_06g258226v5 [Chlamydomonas reinhardtii]PNW81738.1 hypothetical protein CHLRE_06g258226v5 [Chlamydomonas reinhardtii]
MAISGASRKAREGWGFGRVLLLAASLCLVGTALLFLYELGGTSNISGKHVGSAKLTALVSRLRGGSGRFVRTTEVGDIFGTLFHSELVGIIKVQDAGGGSRLLSTLQSMQAAGIKTVMFSLEWGWFEQAEGQLNWAHVDLLAGTACNSTKLKVAMIVDVLRAPGWLFRKWPHSRSFDAGGRNYSHLSWFHAGANAVALDRLQQVATRLSGQFGSCAVAIQPAYNNEYEAKFTQEYDAYQDYNPHGLDTFRGWLQRRQPDLAAINNRWGTKFSKWEEVAPPRLFAGAVMGPDDSARFWDWMRFRTEAGADVLNGACRTVQAAGLQCFHHFPEFFSVLDAIYGATMFPLIAGSNATDFVIMDSNFRTPYGTLMDPSKLRFYVAAARAFGKRTYFEAAVERYASMNLLEAGYRNALLAGAPNLGLTNWLTRVEMNASLTRALLATSRPACAADEVVGVFLHLDSCAAFHGPQWQWARKDPLHDFVEELALRLTARCETDIAVFISLPALTAALPSLDRVVFVEPLLLPGGAAELGAYVAAKAALRASGLPVEALRLPGNGTGGLALKVLDRLEGGGEAVWKE